MLEKLLRVLRAMEREEKVLHSGVVVCLLGLFIPWLGGQWHGKDQQWNGFGFYTGLIGHVVFLLEIFIAAMTLSPLFGGPVIVRQPIRNFVRLELSAVSSILLLTAFTILLRLTSEVSGAEIRFGISISIIGSLLATLYAFLKFDEQRKSEGRRGSFPLQAMMTSDADPLPPAHQDDDLVHVAPAPAPLSAK
jgi:hypothetical protein